MKNKILLIYPRTETDFDIGISQSKIHFTQFMMKAINALSPKTVFKSTKGKLIPPLGLVNLATVTPKNWDIEIRDERIVPISNEEISRISNEYEIVGLTGLTPSISRSYELADKFMQLGVTVVLGGQHVSVLPDEAMEHCNILITGYAELTWIEFLTDYENGNHKKWYQSTKFDFVIPDWNFINRDYYITTNFVEVSRGCHFGCDFCSVVTFFDKLRYRHIPDVINELNRYNNEVVVIVSDNLTSSKNYCTRLFKAIADSKINVDMIVNLSHEFGYEKDMVKLASEAGVKSALIGFETINEDHILEIDKNKRNMPDYSKCIENLHNSGIGITGCFIVGFEWDDSETEKSIYDFAIKNKIECLRISSLIPYPGTPAFTKLLAEKKILHQNWNEYHAYGNSPIKRKGNESEEIRERIIVTLNKYYKPSNILIRLLTHMNFKSYYLPYNISQWYKHNKVLNHDL